MVVQFCLFNGDDKNINIVMKRLEEVLVSCDSIFIVYQDMKQDISFSGKKGKKKNKEAYFDLIYHLRTQKVNL